MKPPSSKLQGQQVKTTPEHQQATQQTAAREFATVEEMMRHDAQQNPPPAELAHRVAESVAALPKPARSWWRQWLAGG